jgi:hypothetical protein
MRSYMTLARNNAKFTLMCTRAKPGSWREGSMACVACATPSGIAHPPSWDYLACIGGCTFAPTE